MRQGLRAAPDWGLHDGTAPEARKRGPGGSSGSVQASTDTPTESVQGTIWQRALAECQLHGASGLHCGNPKLRCGPSMEPPPCRCSSWIKFRSFSVVLRVQASASTPGSAFVDAARGGLCATRTTLSKLGLEFCVCCSLVRTRFKSINTKNAQLQCRRFDHGKHFLIARIFKAIH